jgi:acetyl esterase/lipase
VRVGHITNEVGSFGGLEVGPTRRPGAMTRSIHPYGPDGRQHVELVLPSGAGPHPVVIVVHGGYWRACYDRSLMSDLCADLARNGLAAWSLEYRSVGDGGGWPETFLDVAAGVDLLTAVDLPLELERVTAVGHSAGCQLAVWAAARRRLVGDEPGSGPRVQIGAVVSQAGVLDLRLAAELSPSAEPTRALLGDPAANADAYHIASPIEHLPLGIPQLVLHGELDDVVPMRIADSYAARARETGDACSFVALPGTGHFEHLDAGSEAWRIARDWLFAYASADRS